MKKLKYIAIFLTSLALIYMGASYIYSRALSEERRKEIKTFTEAQLNECIKEKEKKRSTYLNTYCPDCFIHLSADASDRELQEAQCFYENDDVGRYNDCPVFYTSSQHGDINLPVGTIFGYPAKSGENLYDIIRNDTFIMSAYFENSFRKDFRCFETEEEAVAMGYKKFLSNQAGRNKQRLELKEWLAKSPEERKKDCESEGLNGEQCQAKLLWAIDASIGVD